MKESPETRTLINAPPAVVWQTLVQFDKYPGWNPRVKLEGEARQGDSVIMTVKVFNLPLKVPVLLETVSKEQELRWLGGPAWMMCGSHYFKIQPSDTDPDSTVMIQGEQFRGYCVSLILPIMKGELSGLYDDLNKSIKKRSESVEK